LDIDLHSIIKPPADHPFVDPLYTQVLWNEVN